MRASDTGLRRDPAANDCVDGETGPAWPSSFSLCSKAKLSPRNSLKSMKLPLRAFSTAFPGIGGSAGEITRGDVFSGGGSKGRPGEDSRADRLGQEKLVEAIEGGVTVTADEAAVEIRGTEASDDAGGRVALLSRAGSEG